MQPLMINTSHCGKEFMTNNKFYLDDLVRRFKIESLKALPLRSDLKMFESFKFPDTPEGKAFALGFVYNMNENILSCSPVNEPLMQLVIDEAVKLFRSDPDDFASFRFVSSLKKNLTISTLKSKEQP